MNSSQPSSMTVLCWPKRLLSADDLRRHLTGQRELWLLPRTVITPLAADELKARGIRVLWQVLPKEASSEKSRSWCYAQEGTDSLIASALQALEREGISLFRLDSGSPRRTAEIILAGNHPGGIVFCDDPATVCCITNKVPGIRAASVSNVTQVIQVKKKLGPNLFAIDVPGRTFFELRQMLKTIVTGDGSCPEAVATTLKELDGHAHR